LSKSVLKESPLVQPWRQISPPTTTAWSPAPTSHGGGPGAPGTAVRTGRPDEHGQPAPPEAVLQWARTEAERIVQQAREEAEQIRAEAARDGFAAGRASAVEEAAAECRRLAELLDQMDATFQSFCADQVPALADLATQAAGQLVRGQLERDPGQVLTIVQQAMEHAVASSKIVMHLHPDDLDQVGEYIASRNSRQTPGVQIVADPAVERGGCWLETEQGEVDATVDGRLSRLDAALDELG
jgi:flagellar assembly protein FliH